MTTLISWIRRQALWEGGPSWDAAPGLASGRAPGKQAQPAGCLLENAELRSAGLKEATRGPCFGLKGINMWTLNNSRPELCASTRLQLSSEALCPCRHALFFHIS